MKSFYVIVFTLITIVTLWFYIKKNDVIVNKPSGITESKTEVQPKIQTETTKEPDTQIAQIPVEDTPIVEGIKARASAISDSDELYQAEFVESLEKASMAEPKQIRPKQPYIKWVLQFSASVAGGIALQNDRLYFGTYDFQAFIINGNTGDVIFNVKTASQPVNTTRISKDLFLVPQRNGQVTAFHLSDGAKKWDHLSIVDKQNNPIDLSISGIAVYDKKFYVSKHWGNLYIADIETGFMVQDVGVTYESRINLPAIKTKDGILFSNVAGEIHCFKDNGESDWEYTIPKGYPLSMALNETTLYLATTEKELIALNTTTRKIIWIKELPGYAYDSIVVHKNLLYMQAKDLLAIDMQSNQTIWSISSNSKEGFCRGAPVIIADHIYATEQNGRLIQANLKDGTITKEVNLKETIRSPISATNDLLFIPTIQKRIYAISLGKFK